MDPSTPRQRVPFTWHVTCGMPAYSALAGVRFDRTFRDAGAIAQAYEVGRPKAEALYGPHVRYLGPSWSGISYGHVSCLGAPLTFPEDSEVGVSHIYDSLDQGIRALERPVDWAAAGDMPFYLDLWEDLKTGFPDLDLPFAGFGVEGPMTTGWELRGHDFFMDAYLDPDRYHPFMRLVTDSIIGYSAFVRSLNGQPAVIPGALGLVDDLAAQFGPHVWADWVMPYEEQYFQQQTTGGRRAHIEALTADHLPFLDELRLDQFDPGVSPGLRAEDLRDRCDIPFLWRVNAMHLRDLSIAQIQDYVLTGVTGGASGAFISVSRIMLDAEFAGKIHAFIDMAQWIEAQLEAGMSRDALRDEYPGAR